MHRLRSPGPDTTEARPNRSVKRRLLALAVAPALVLALPVLPARAQSQPPVTIQFVSPTPADQALVSGNGQQSEVRFTASVSNQVADSIASWQVDIVDAAGKTHPLCKTTYPIDPNSGMSQVSSIDVDFKWDTTRWPDKYASNCGNGAVVPASGPASGNGATKIHVTVTDAPLGGGGQAFTADRGVRVNNGVSTPADMKLAYSESASKIAVSWNANPEPDLSGYVLQECVKDNPNAPCGNNDWRQIAAPGPSVHSVTVDIDGPGTFHYRVSARRPGGDGQAKVSDWAYPQSDPRQITVAEKPSTTTTGPSTTTTTVPAVIQVTQAPAPPAPMEVKSSRSSRGTPRVVENTVVQDRGYQQTLPYSKEKIQDAATGGRPIDGNSDGGGDQRAILVPLAAGALFVVLALQVRYLNQRSGLALEPIAVSSPEFDEGPRRP